MAKNFGGFGIGKSLFHNCRREAGLDQIKWVEYGMSLTERHMPLLLFLTLAQ